VISPGSTALLGSAVGLILAHPGAGGGVLAVPLLVFAASLPMQQAAPAALLGVGLAALLGALLGLREGIVRYRAALVLGGTGMLLAPLGLSLARTLPQPPLLVAFAALMLLASGRMLSTPRAAGADRRPAPCQRPDPTGRLQWTWRCAAVLGSVGGFTGLLSGALGVGGGFVIVPALERFSNLDLRSIQATSLAVIALVSGSATTSALWQGQLSGDVALPFSGGAAAGLLAGRALARVMPANTLRMAFAGVSVVVALMLLARAITPA
jgi:uncharacterized membrane protein YfcA